MEKEDYEEIGLPEDILENDEEGFQVEKLLIDSASSVSGSEEVSVYDRSGRPVFKGTPDQLIIFWNNGDYGEVENIGGIYNQDGNPLVRFGAQTGFGFIDRSHISEVFEQIKDEVKVHKILKEESSRLQSVKESLGLIEKKDPVSNIIDKENVFNSDRMEEVLGVAQDWVKYGGDFYGHLTGKDIKLEKGVDYALNPDGGIDMESFRAARNEKIATWLNNPKNAEWIAAGKRFVLDHPQDLGYREKLEVTHSNGTVSEEYRPTTPFFHEDGWIYYEPNYVDKETGVSRLKEREDTAYRIYINCDSDEVIRVFEEVVNRLNQDSDLRRLGFQAKTSDISAVSPSEIGQMMHQKDRIVIYLGEEGAKKALPIIQDYATENEGVFEEQGVLLAQPLEDNNKRPIPGIRMTSETKGKSPDPQEINKSYSSFSDMQSKIITSSLKSIINQLNKPDVLNMVSSHYPSLGKRLSGVPANISLREYIGIILEDDEGKTFLSKNLEKIYPQWSQSFGMSDNISFKKKV